MIRNPRAYEAAVQRRSHTASPPPAHYEWTQAYVERWHTLGPAFGAFSLVAVAVRPDGNFNILNTHSLAAAVLSPAVFAQNVHPRLDGGQGVSAGDMDHVWQLCKPQGA
jgi:hypothetical protein